MNDDIKDFVVGDKVVVNDDGLTFLKVTYDPEDIQFLKDTVYGIVVRLEQRYLRHVIVKWVNHKGMVTEYEWYIHNKYIDLYQDVPRET